MKLKTEVVFRDGRYEIVASSGGATGVTVGAFRICPQHGVEMEYGVYPTEEELEAAKRLEVKESTPLSPAEADALKAQLKVFFGNDLEKKYGPETREIFEALLEELAS